MKYLLWLLVFLTASACADDTALRHYDRPLDFSLALIHGTSDLDYGNTAVDTSFDRITLAWRERYGERLQLGLLGGPTRLTQSNNPATSGRELAGYHAGVSLDVDLARTNRFDAFFSANWIYQQVDDSNGTQKVVVNTREPNAQLGAGLTVGAGGRFYGGVRYSAINGEQRLSGTIDETRTIKETRRSGGFAGFEQTLEEDGYIGLAAQTGSNRTVSIYFGRHF